MYSSFLLFYLISQKEILYIKLVNFCKYTFHRNRYTHLPLGWQIAKQLSGLNHFSLRNNKNDRLNRSFSFVINVKWLLT